MADEEENENSAARQRAKALAVTDPRSYETPVSVSPVSRALFDALSIGGSTAELADLMIEATEDPEILDYVRGVQGLPSSKVTVNPQQASIGFRAFTDIGINDLLMGLPFPAGFYAYVADRALDDDQAKMLAEMKNAKIAGFERLTEDQKLEMTEERHPGDFDMIIDLYDVGSDGQKMPLFCNLILTEQGLFAETPIYKTLMRNKSKKQI